jgi:hypothetical protein
MMNDLSVTLHSMYNKQSGYKKNESALGTKHGQITDTELQLG